MNVGDTSLTPLRLGLKSVLMPPYGIMAYLSHLRQPLPVVSLKQESLSGRENDSDARDSAPLCSALSPLLPPF